MKKLRQILAKAAGLGAALGITVSVLLYVTPVVAVPYQGANTPPLSSPAFNQFTGVPSQGDESDFFRGRESGVGTFVNNECH